MSDDDDLAFVLEQLSSTTEARFNALSCLVAQPLKEWRLVSILEALLGDTTPCIVGRPYHYAEIRWMAARALAKVLAELGVSRDVMVEAVPPISGNELALKAEAEHVSRRGGHEGAFYAFVVLRERGSLKTKLFTF